MDIHSEIVKTINRATDDSASRTADYADAIVPLVKRAQAEAWDEGMQAGLLRADYEYGAIGFHHVRSNPYRAHRIEQGEDR